MQVVQFEFFHIFSLPLQFVSKFLVSLNFANSFSSIIGLWMVFPFIVNEHSDEFIVHDLHVHLQKQNAIFLLFLSLVLLQYLALLEWL